MHIQDHDHDDEDDDDDGGRQADAEGRVEKYLGVKVKVQKERCIHISLYLFFRLISFWHFCFVGVLYWSRRDTVNETIVGRPKDRRCSRINLCHPEMRSCTILSF